MDDTDGNSSNHVLRIVDRKSDVRSCMVHPRRGTAAGEASKLSDQSFNLATRLTLSTDRMVNPILDNVDLAIRTGTRLADSDLRSRRLADVNLIAVCSPELAEQLLELDVVPSVEFVRQDRTAIDFPSCPVLRSPRLRTNGYLTLVDAIRQGVGMGVVPRSIVARDLAEGRLVQVLPEWKLPTGRVWAVYPSRGQLPQKIRRMLDALADGWKLDELAGGL